MNTVIDLPELRTRVVSSNRDIEALRWFQTNRYFEGGVIDTLPSELPFDPAVARSIYFGVYSGGSIQATARIIRDTGGLPMLTHHTIYPYYAQLLDEHRGSVGEISRLAVSSSTPHYRALEMLSREFLRYGLRNQHATLLVASVAESLVRILNRLLGVPLTIIGPPLEKYGNFNGAGVPILIDTVACLDNFRSQKSRRWEFFTEDLVIDLTGADSLTEEGATPNR